jgi:hypothetical protein
VSETTLTDFVYDEMPEDLIAEIMSDVMIPEKRKRSRKGGISVLRVLRTFFMRKNVYPLEIYYVGRDTWIHVRMMDQCGVRWNEQFSRHAIWEMHKFNRSLKKLNPEFDDATTLF